MKRNKTRSVNQAGIIRTRLVMRAGRIATAVLLLLLVFYTVLQAAWPDTAIRLFGFKPYLVSDTGSMEPLLRQNDLIIVLRGNVEHIQLGDVIAFWSPALLNDKPDRVPVTHRVLEVLTDPTTGATLYRTGGINPATNPEPDLRPVSADGIPGTNRYIGTYAFTIPVLGHVIAFLKSPFGLIAMAFNFVVYLAARHLRRGEAETGALQL